MHNHSLLRGYGLARDHQRHRHSQHQPAGFWLWSRVVGDVIDMATLATTYANGTQLDRERAVQAASLLPQSPILDVVCRRGPHAAIPSFDGTAGLKRPRTHHRQELAMKALVWHGKERRPVRHRPGPEDRGPDATSIIKVTSTCICGSDLHLYDMYLPAMKPGDILGHEPMGEVVEVGSAVTKLKKGDRVVVPFDIACGECWFCKQRALLAAATPPTRTPSRPRR